MTLREQGPSHLGYVAPGGQEGDLTNGLPGGLCIVMKATVALNIGDSVILTTATVDEVTKDATSGNHFRRAGIVVGGRQTGMKALTGPEAVGVAAAAIGEQVLVCHAGIAWAVAQAAITRGAKVRPDTTTAGRVLSGTDTTDLAAGITGSILGSAMDSAAAGGDKVRILVALG